MIIHNAPQGEQAWRELRAGKPTASQFGRITPNDRGEFLLSVLRAVHDGAAESRVIAEALGAKKSLVDGALNPLADDGFLIKEKSGRSNIWTISEEGASEIADPGRLCGLPEAAEGYINELIAERCCGPMPEIDNYWTRRGKELEPIARDWLAMALDVDIQQPGFITTDCGRIGCSPDGLIEGAGIEIKNLAPKNHVAALRADAVPVEHLPQCHGGMIVCEMSQWWFLSFCPGLRPLLKRVTADDRTRKLEDAVWTFVDRLEAAYREVAE